MITATLQNYRQSPRKVRVVADLVRGKKVEKALTTLDFLSKQATDPVRNVIKMAVSNAKENFKLDSEKLFVKEIQVNEGPTMKRFRPRARGSAFQIKKRTSHISVILDEVAKQ